VHTAIVIGVGLLLLAACLLVGRLLGGPGALPTAALVFLPVWLLGAGVNMAIGVKRAGYTVAEEGTGVPGRLRRPRAAGAVPALAPALSDSPCR
jgi:hypothetical protein